jgi:multidrug efflux system outer membrane protein
MRQGESELARAEGSIANIRMQASAKEQELNVLLGRMPGTLPRGAALMNQKFETRIPPGLPSALLQRRPDISESENQLRSANAMIGAAIAARFPTISLTGAGGTRTDAIENLFQAGTGFWHLATNILLPIINAGRSGKQVQIERARTEAAVARYDLVVLNAFREVEDGLVAVEQFQIQVGAGAAGPQRDARSRSRRIATRGAWTTTPRCSTRSACSPMPSWGSRACSGSSAWRWCSCTGP